MFCLNNFYGLFGSLSLYPVTEKEILPVRSERALRKIYFYSL